MERNLKVVLTAEGNEFGANCVKALASYGCEVKLVKKDGRKLLEAIESEKPNAVVMDAFLSNIDALGVVERVKGSKKFDDMLLMVMSGVDNQRFEQEILSAGVDYYFRKPFDVNVMGERIRRMSDKSQRISTQHNELGEPMDLQVTVSEIMHQIGVPAHIKGYQYLREAIILSIDDTEMMNSVTRCFIRQLQRNFRLHRRELSEQSATLSRLRGIGETLMFCRRISATQSSQAVVSPPIPSLSQ